LYQYENSTFMRTENSVNSSSSATPSSGRQLRFGEK